MNINQIHICILVVSIIISLLAFSLLLIIATNYKPQKAVAQTLYKINSRLKENRNRIFDYEKIMLFLNKNGATYHIGKTIEPIRYIALRIVFSAMGILIGIQYHPIVPILLAFVAFQLPKFYVVYQNKQDNEKLLSEIKLIFNSLSVQICAGIYVTDALTECYGIIKDKRLKNAFKDLSGEIIMKSNVNESLVKFQNNFDNRYIDSLCLIVIQSLESGQAVELLKDIGEQIKDMESSLLQKRKGKLDRNTTFCLLGIMTVILAVVIYACMSQITQASRTF